jgi:hypothetical protein
MPTTFRCRSSLILAIIALFAVSLTLREAKAADVAPPIEEGQRILSAGHSFHVFMPKILTDLAAAAEIEGHKQLAVQSIGGSRVIQHWDRADEMNVAKRELNTGNVDVLTLSPIYLPDEGIENFVRLALEKNPKTRILIQEFWLPFDIYQKDYKQRRPEPVDRNTRTGEEMRAVHAPYFADVDAHVRELNDKYKTNAVFVVPTGQAIIALREKIIAGEAPSLTQQNDLFRDAIGHGNPPLQVLVAYCFYASIYRRSPEGLPVPAALKNVEHGEELNRLLQQLAWQAVTEHPLSGVSAQR